MSGELAVHGRKGFYYYCYQRGSDQSAFCETSTLPQQFVDLLRANLDVPQETNELI